MFQQRRQRPGEPHRHSVPQPRLPCHPDRCGARNARSGNRREGSRCKAGSQVDLAAYDLLPRPGGRTSAGKPRREGGGKGAMRRQVSGTHAGANRPAYKKSGTGTCVPIPDVAYPQRRISWTARPRPGRRRESDPRPCTRTSARACPRTSPSCRCCRSSRS